MYIHHICIQTNNYNNSLLFYTKVLNFNIIEETKDFNNREYNTWLELNGFMIELQTGKASEALGSNNIKTEGIVHFCLFSDNFDVEYNSIKNSDIFSFKTKNGNDIYKIGINRLFKLIAPEGTIIEIRDSKTI